MNDVKTADRKPSLSEPEKHFPDEQYFEDFEVGDIFRGNPSTLTEQSIVEFGKAYDPQSFHIDPEAAKKSQFGGLIASGMQTMGLGFKGLIEAGFLKGGGMGSPGLETVRWHQPVRPGDTITMQARVLRSWPSTSRDDRGYIDMSFEVLNQRDELVLSYTCVEILKPKSAA